MEVGSIAKVVNDFLSLNEGELSLNKGDIVQILKVEDMHWCYGISAGKQGLIPTNYLLELEDPVLEENNELFAALADFPAQQSGDLFFIKGEIIIGLNPEDDNWWKGKIDDRIGVFPRNYVWKLDGQKFKSNSSNSTMCMKARVKTSMTAQLDEEMDLHEGDIITITGVVDKMWYRGVCGNREGIFPKDFVTLLNDNDESMRKNHTEDARISTISSHSSYSSTVNNFDNLTLPQFTSQPSYSSNVNGFQNVASLPYSSQPSFSSNVNDFQNLDLPLFSCHDPDPKHGSLITFSPDENKDLHASDQFSRDSFNEDNLNSVFSSIEQSSMVDSSGTSDDFSGCNDNCGLSPYGITLYPFYGQFDNELSFHEGEIVTLIRHIDDDWIEGEIEGKKGIFPVSYVNILVDCGYSMGENNKASSKSHVNYRLRQNASAKVVYNFHAQMNGDISVSEGEIVMITELVNEDWCRVKNSDEVIGLCPSNHLAPLSASEELIGLQIPQTPSSLDDLPSYNDIYSTPNHNYSRSSLNDSKLETSHGNFDFPTSNKRPKSVDDFIAKNIATLDFSLKSVKVPAEADEPKSCFPADSISGLSCEKSSDHVSDEKLKSACSSGSNIQESSRTQTQAPRRPIPPVSAASRSLSYAGSSQVPSVVNKEKPEKKSDTGQMNNSVPVITYAQVEFRRQGSDRVPHRPAPPIPVPGQKPVRRTLPRNNILSPSSAPSSSIQTTLPPKEERQCERTSATVLSGISEKREKDNEHRQNIISELVITEKEYVRDLKLTYETFNLHNEEFLESRGINVQGIFGNIKEVMRIAETLLDKILFAMKNKGDGEQLVGPCFLELADEMKAIYSQYCMNHDTALTLLEKYESNEQIQKIFDKGIETLRYQVACFDMGSLLIKPVQRILKYPLILNELIKYTEESHQDKPFLLEAVKRMTEVAMHINEFKRRKDLVTKYLDDGNATLTNRMSKLSLHSVLKKSSRLGMKLSSSLGIGLIAKDTEFDAQELLFRSLEKSIKTFLRNVELFSSALEEVVSCQCNIGEIISNCFDENKYSGVSEFKETQKIIFSKYLVEYKSVIDFRVLKPLNMLMDLFEGPEKLIQKRNDKLLDYNRSLAKSEKSKEARVIQDEVVLSKNNYDALNSQLLEELPKLVVIAYEMFMECVAEFISARKLFTGRATKQYLSLCENHLVLSHGDIMEVFAVKHYLVSNQIGRFNFVTKNFTCESNEVKDNKSPILGNKQSGAGAQISQGNSQRVYLQSRYPQEKLFVVKESYTPIDPLDLPVGCGHIVAVIKNQDPMGNNKRWFVDSGGCQGFLPAAILQPLYSSAPPSLEKKGRPLRCAPDPLSLEGKCDSVSTKKSGDDGNKLIHGSVSSKPPAYEEVVQHSVLDPYSESRSHSLAVSPADHRYEEPDEDSTYNSHLYSEIPEGDGSTQNEFYYSLYNFDGSGAHTLPVRSGQVLKVKSQQDLLGNSEWWLVEDRDGKSGYVPGNYLKKYL